MRHCDGRLFDGSACNNDVLECEPCGVSGCTGDGCDNQQFATETCDCGASVSTRELATSAA
jgi:hypothetical protein